MKVRRKLQRAGHAQTGKTLNAECRPLNATSDKDQAYRVISTGKLHTLLRFHIRPINVMVYHDSQGILVSR